MKVTDGNDVWRQKSGVIEGAEMEKFGGRGFDFFFQAEDGIRDRTVTGVQTCALPICLLRIPSWVWSLLVVVRCPVVRKSSSSEQTRDKVLRRFTLSVTARVGGTTGQARSEERRVGKEGWIRRSREQWRKERQAAGRRS